jgi:predicted dehydrogenase
MRLLLGPENRIDRISAFTSQIRSHLPPTDTLDAIWKTQSGVTGTFSISFGTTLVGASHTVGCEKGMVSVQRDVVVVRREDEEGERRVEFKEQGWGVKREVRDWAAAVEAGERIQRLSPEEAYKDLVVVSPSPPFR